MLKGKVLQFFTQKTFVLFRDPLFFFTTNSNILDHLEISWFGPIFKSSPRLEIDAHILVAQAEIKGLLFPLAYLWEQVGNVFVFVSHIRRLMIGFHYYLFP